VSPRAIAHIFQEVAARRETAFTVSATYMEIYNEKIFDLLLNPAAAAEDGSAHGELTIAEDKGGRGTYVRGLTSVQVNIMCFSSS
jgi:kinesin family member 6/9